MLPSMLRGGSGLSTDPDPVKAVREACERALAATSAAGASAAFVFAAGHEGAEERLARGAVEVLGTRAVAGVVAHGVLAGAVEEQERPAAAALVLSALDATPFLLAELSGAEDAAGGELEAALGRSAREGDLLVLFADALALDLPRLVHALGDVLPPGALVGAGSATGTSARGAPPWCGTRLATAGACGLVLHLPAPPRTLLCQGCRPITEPLAVTRCDGHWLLELEGRPALDVYREAAGAPLAADLRRAVERLLVALPRGETDGFVARSVTGFDSDRRAFALAEALRAGARIRLALRDGDLAREDLARTLAAAGDPPAAGIYLSGSSRGARLFRHAGLESAYVARALGGAPVAGGFGSFQLGPIGGASELFTHAGVLVLLPGSERAGIR
jgi:small ligand-binding sensory domain FIST